MLLSGLYLDLKEEECKETSIPGVFVIIKALKRYQLQVTTGLALSLLTQNGLCQVGYFFINLPKFINYFDR